MELKRHRHIWRSRSNSLQIVPLVELKPCARRMGRDPQCHLQIVPLVELKRLYPYRRYRRRPLQIVPLVELKLNEYNLNTLQPLNSKLYL